MPKLQSPILMAVIGAPHGIRGEVRVKSFADDPIALSAYGPLSSADGRAFEVEAVRPQGAIVVVRLKGVADRAAAEALTGTDLFIDRSALPEAVEEGEFYHADLIGLAVRDEEGAAIGEVTAVQNYGGGDILEIGLAGQRGVLVPFTRAAVPEIDVAAGFIRIDRTAAGLTVDDAGDSEAREASPGTLPPRRTARKRGPKEAGGNR